MSVDRTTPGDGEYALVDVGGYGLAIHCLVGEGSPAVVLERGLGAPSEYLALVQQEIAGLARVCRFDRAGWEKSAPAPTTTRTCADMVTDLRGLPHNARIPAPYVLVENSLGGMNARLYAYWHPEEVAKLMLVDGSHRDQFTRMGEAPPESEPNSPDSHKGFYRFWAGGGWRDPANNPGNVAFVGSREQLRAIHSLGDLPVVLASGAFLREPPTRPEAGPRLHKMWQALQRELASLSSKGIYRIVEIESSGHSIRRDRPEAVVDAIRWVLNGAPRRRVPPIRKRGTSENPLRPKFGGLSFHALR